MALRSRNKLVFMFIAFANQKAVLNLGARGAPRRGGFTLLEITLAVAILATMSLAIYRFSLRASLPNKSSGKDCAPLKFTRASISASGTKLQAPLTCSHNTAKRWDSKSLLTLK